MPQIYLNDSYIKEIETKIIEIRTIKKKDAIVLEDNIFYPSGGGQLFDIGYIEISEERIKVLRTMKLDGKIYLCLENDISHKDATKVKAILDWDKRYKYMRCHTAAHLLMSEINRNVENYAPDGIEILEDGKTVIVRFSGTWNKSIDTANKIIDNTNNKIKEGAVVYTETYLDSINIEEKYKNIYRGEKDLNEGARIVTIENTDANPCGGTHLKDIKEIGEVKLIEFEEDEFKIEVI